MIPNWLLLIMRERAMTKASLVRSSRHCAAIVHKNRLITIGVNQYKTHPLMLKWGRNDKSIYLHAEIDAIRNFLRECDAKFIPHCDMYVIRVNKAGKIMPSKPCEGCMRAIIAMGFKGVYWS